MKKVNALLSLVVLVLCAAMLFASCTGTGDETTAAPEVSSEITEAPETNAPDTSSEVETTQSSPDVTTEEITNEVTTAPEVTTEAPEVTTEAPEVTTEAPHTHSFGAWTTLKAATCTAGGSEERACSCGEKETRNTEALGHKDGKWITDKAADCTEEGSKHQVCSVCGETVKTDTIPALGHKEGEWIVDKEATAEADGSKHQVCSVCGATLKTEIIASKPHTPGKWITDKDATCTEEGSKHQVCSECGVTLKTESIPEKGHTEVTDAAVAATCTKSGLTEGEHCSVCNTVIKAQEIIPAKGHTEVTDAAVAATCTKSGLTEGKHCSVCNTVTKSQETLPAKGHTEVTDAAVAATCTKSGLTEGKHCSVCNAVIKAQETVKATGHKDGEWIVDKQPTTKAEGSKHLVCANCGETLKTEAIPMLEPEKIDYTVTVVDGTGNPIAGINVSFMNGSSEEAKVKTDASGKAVAKLEVGNYTVVLEANDKYYFPAETYNVTENAPSVEIGLVNYAENPQMVYPDEKNGVYTVPVGRTRVSVKKDEMRYFYFAPTEGAIYHVYTDSDKVEVGYYGASFYVSNNNTGTMLENGAMELKVLHSSIGNILVIGLKSTSSSVEECTLTIVRYSDIDVQLVELPWEQYQLNHTPEKFEAPEGNLRSVSITVQLPAGGAVSEIPVVYNESDGYYHLNSADGPVLYVKLNAKTVFQESIQVIANVTNIGRYLYDEDGNFLKKESYNDAILAYCAAADDKYGIVPLDADLIYILKNAGEGGWYDMTSPNSIFKDDGVVVMPFNGWLFACCYFG